MKRPNITPGDWRIDKKASFRIHGDEDRQVAACGGRSSNSDTERTEEENRANTIAIAAVPDVLKALEPFAAYFSGDLANVGGGTLILPSFTVQKFKDARAALLKAGYTF
jgi:hypothetical protein